MISPAASGRRAAQPEQQWEIRRHPFPDPPPTDGALTCHDTPPPGTGTGPPHTSRPSPASRDTARPRHAVDQGLHVRVGDGGTPRGALPIYVVPGGQATTEKKQAYLETRLDGRVLVRDAVLADGTVSPAGAIVVGCLAGMICAVAIGLKNKFGFVYALDGVGVHLVGGMCGTLSIRVIATPTETGIRVGRRFCGRSPTPPGRPHRGAQR